MASTPSAAGAATKSVSWADRTNRAGSDRAGTKSDPQFRSTEWRLKVSRWFGAVTIPLTRRRSPDVANLSSPDVANLLSFDVANPSSRPDNPDRILGSPLTLDAPPSTPTSPTPTRSVTVVVSRGQSRNPEKRGIETAIAESAAKLSGVEVVVVPHLYDLPADGEALTRLKQSGGDVLVVSWIFPRAARWVLDRNGIRGRDDVAEPSADDSKPEADDSKSDADDAEPRVTDLYPRPDRRITCIDLKQSDSAAETIDRIADFCRHPAAPTSAETFKPDDSPHRFVGGTLSQLTETTKRRWYPVIDFDRCTNCMECVDFCLFGVYGLDDAETILVEQPDNCRKGCPACSRVCPENAIIFPGHKAPAIAGAEVEGDEGFKIDLSQLFGKPSEADDPIATAARERDEQLLLTGRSAVGIDDQLARRQLAITKGPKDELDDLIDQLDAIDV